MNWFKIIKAMQAGATRGHWITPSGYTYDVNRTHGDLFEQMITDAPTRNDPIPQKTNFGPFADKGYIRVVNEPSSNSDNWTDLHGRAIDLRLRPTSAQIDALLKIFPKSSFNTSVPMYIEINGETYPCETFEKLYTILTSKTWPPNMDVIDRQLQTQFSTP